MIVWSEQERGRDWDRLSSSWYCWTGSSLEIRLTRPGEGYGWLADWLADLTDHVALPLIIEKNTYHLALFLFTSCLFDLSYLMALSPPFNAIHNSK